jgi:hypothetical protein
VLKPAALTVALVASASPVSAQAVRTLPVTASDLAYSPLTGRLYASVTATNSITEIDPVAGTVGVSFVVGSQPNKLAISDTGEYLYVGLDGLPGVVRVHLPSRTVGTPFALGTPDPALGARAARDLLVLPGNPDAVVVARQFLGLSPGHAGVAVYDNGVQRPVVGEAFNTISSVIAFGASATRLYGYDTLTSGFGFQRMDIGPTGVTIVDRTEGLLDGATDIEYFGGRVYGTNGRVIDPEALTVLTTIPFVNANNALEPTATHIYYVVLVGSPLWNLVGFDPTTFAPTYQQLFTDGTGLPRALVSTGPDRLAHMTTDGQVTLIIPSALVPAPPVITITGPTTAPTLAVEASSITLTGTAADPNLDVPSVTWFTNRGYVGAANGAAAWTAGDIPLLPGSNVITVRATDTGGTTADDTIEVTVTAFSSFLAEGATGNFFDYDLALANPSLASVDAEISWFTQSGATVTQTVTLPAQSRRTVLVDQVAGLDATTMSTQVRTTTAPIVVERTMRWGQGADPQYGAHGDKATAGAATTWYFAEGAQGSFFTYLLLANPGGANTATIDWLIEGGAPVQRTVNLPPASRTTIDAGADQALANRSFGIVVTFAQPAVAERAMYFGTTPLFNAGHDSAGVTAPSTRWFLAEGATGPFFETFILLANPNPVAADVTLRFLTDAGLVVQRSLTIPALSRRTLDIEGLTPAAPELANAAVATEVNATQPIIAERAQYWPGVGASWYEAHNSFGVASPKSKWGLAEGRVGNPPGVPPASYQTYVLLANPGTLSANVTIQFLRESGPPIVKLLTVPPASRRNVAVAGPGSTVPELADEHFGAIIESDQPIVVERAMYGNAGTQVFGLGTNATATPLP